MYQGNWYYEDGIDYNVSIECELLQVSYQSNYDGPVVAKGIRVLCIGVPNRRNYSNVEVSNLDYVVSYPLMKMVLTMFFLATTFEELYASLKLDPYIAMWQMVCMFKRSK